jgi:RimJ/RimL family protein N-acetyltransferase
VTTAGEGPGPAVPIEIAAGAWHLLPLSASDAAELAPVLADPVIERWSPAGMPRTPDDLDAWMARRLDGAAAGTGLTWTVRTAVGGHIAGLVEAYALSPDLGSADLGCFTAADHRRQGVARTAVGAVTRYLHHGVGLHRVQWMHAVDNEPSCALALRCGFAHEGTLRSSGKVQGEWVDEHLHARLDDDPPVSA